MPTFPPFHQDLTFLSPLSDERAGRLVGLPDRARARHGARRRLRLGRAAAARPRGRPGRRAGSGSTSTRSPSPARGASAAERGLGDARDLRGAGRPRGAAGRSTRVTCIGASQIWGPHVEEAQPLDYAAALTALRALLPRGGRLVYGEGIWSAPPTPAATAPLSGRDDEYVTLGELVDARRGARLRRDGRPRGVTRRVGRVRVRLRGWLGALAGRARARRPGGRRGALPPGAPACGVLRWLPRRPRAWPTCIWWRCERRDRAGRRRRPRPGHRRRAGGDRQRRARGGTSAATTPRRRSCSSAATATPRGPMQASGWPGEDGRLVGTPRSTLNLFENLDGAKILGAVHPAHQRSGHRAAR